MLIALDFDDTYTADPDLWNNFIRACFDRGHKVQIVTARHWEYDRLAMEPYFDEIGVPILYCDGEPKRDVAKQKGLKFDVWIDDKPEGVLYPSAYRRGSADLARWRETDPHSDRGRARGAEGDANVHGSAGLLPRRISGGGAR